MTYLKRWKLKVVSFKRKKRLLLIYFCFKSIFIHVLLFLNYYHFLYVLFQ